MKKIILLLALFVVSFMACTQQEEQNASNNQNERSLIFLNRNVLNRVKCEIQREDVSVMPAYQQLIADVEKILTEGTFTVISKKQVPPSGDKHDYVSRGPYWWPDSTKVDGLPYIRKDGLTNPEFYDFTDHTYAQKVASYVYKLGLAYYFTEDERYAAHAADLLKTWFLNEDTKMNPHLNYGQQIPGITEGRGIGLIDTRAWADMIDGVILIGKSKSWSDDDEAGLRKWFSDFCSWMLNSPIGQDEQKQHNNHGTYYDIQVTAYAIYTGQTAVARNQLEEVTKRRLDSQLAEDGEQPFEMARTNPWGYCGMNLLGFVKLANMAEKLGVDLWNYETPKGVTIRKAIEWYFPFLSGDKAWPKEEIAGKRGASSLISVLMEASRYDKQGYKDEIDKVLNFTGDNYDVDKSILQLTYPIFYGPVTDDAMLFDAINLNYPGLETVKADVAKSDYAAAKTDYVKYLKTREYPKWTFDWRDYNNQASRVVDYDRTEADKIANNLLVSCSVPHQFGEIVDWSINPTPLKYNEWTWQLSRHPFWSTLGKAYWATGDEKYAEAFVKQMTGWVDSNPLPDYSANVAYSRWRTIESGIRTANSWPNSFFYFLGSPSFDDEAIIMMVKSFYEHGLHLRAYPQRNNWLTMEMNGLFHIGILFPEFKLSKEWCEYASQRLYEEEQVQIYPDGAQVELAPGYHGVSLNNMLGIYGVSKINNYELPADYVKGLENMYDYYVKIFMPDGCMPGLNDSGWGNARSQLEKGFSYFPEHTDYQYLVTKGEKGTIPSFTSIWMPWSGWYIMRSGWDANALYSHFEVGPYSPAHQHEDKLSVIISAYGRRLLTEGGTYAYDTSQWRKYVLSSRAHNVTRVDGNDQNRGSVRGVESIRYTQEPLTNRWITNEKFDFGEGWYDEGFGSKLDSTVTQYRALTFIKNKYWLLFDVFIPSDTRTHTYQSWFHFNTPNSQTDAKLGAVMSDDKDVSNLAIVKLWDGAFDMNVVCGQEQPEVQGWVPIGAYGATPVATPTFNFSAIGQCVTPYLLYPMKQGESLPLQSVNVKEDNTIEVEYKNGDKDVIQFAADNKQLNQLKVTSIKNNVEETLVILGE